MVQIGDILKPHGRTAYSHVNKENQAWAQKKVVKEGTDVFGNKKEFLVEDGHFRCECGAIVYLRKSFAVCDGCGAIFNDGIYNNGESSNHTGSNRQKKASLERFKYMCCHTGM